MTRRRPLRSVLVGDVDLYLSEFAFGVAQAMTLAGHWHTTVNIRQPLDVIVRRLNQVQPDVIWGHMLLWPPGGQSADGLLHVCAGWRRAGARVIIHDGDARAEPRHPTDVSAAVDLALCNHTHSREVWKVPQLHWPYFAFHQQARAAPVDEFRCDLAFAGRFGDGLYAGRTAFVHALQARLGPRFRIFPTVDHAHTLMRTPELAASAGAVLGYGRPGALGWVDVRVFQYPGAGAVLLHDDVGGFLTPWEHYAPYESGSMPSLLEALARLATLDTEALRDRAFTYVQTHHTASVRVRHALEAVGLAL